MAERAGKIRSLLVRPIRSADVAFNMAGVIDLHNQELARLGAYVAGFSLNRLYTDIETEIMSHARQITFTADEIRERLERDSVSNPGGAVENHVLFSLRNESLRASLEQAILRRDNAFRDKYQFRTNIATLFSDIYKTNDWNVDPDASTEVSPDSKVGRLLTLQKACQDRFLKVREEYNRATNNNAGVALSTDTDTTSRGRTINESSITATIGNRTQGTYEAGALNPTTGAPDFNNDGFFRTSVNALAPDANTNDQVLTHDKQDAKPIIYTGDGTTHKWDGVVARPGVEGSWVMTNRNVVKQVGLTSGGGGITEAGEMSVVQTATTKHRTYTFPRRENDEEFQRTQLGLQDEILDEKITTMGVPEMEQMMTNELEIMDWEINKLQLNYAHTYLVPPFDGIVTAVYKDLGESVVAGEPVLRIDDHTRLLLVGRIQFRGVLRLDDPIGATGKVRIRTSSLFEDGQMQEFRDVKIVSIRGHDADNDEYDLILELENPTIDPGDDPDDPKTPRVLPINYHFDRDDTEIFFDV